MHRASFEEAAEHILSLEVDYRVNRLGGYGPDGEVIYEAHPMGCPSTLVDNQVDNQVDDQKDDRRSAAATFTSNGSLDFVVQLKDGMEVRVLDGSFDPVEKRETGVPSSNVWLEVAPGDGKGDGKYIASIINPRANVNLTSEKIKIVKLGDPERAMWYCASLEPGDGIQLDTAVRLALVYVPQGPAITREIFVHGDIVQFIPPLIGH